ncbi:MAG: fimbria/pilus periplasmic chaperone [Betaproteobacteria bacterium]
MSKRFVRLGFILQKRYFKFQAAILLAVCCCAPVFAGVFTVTPVRIFMSPTDRAVAVTVTNEGDTELVMQADLYLWKQKPDGQDDLTLTEDIFLSPPIIKLAPKSRQVVRLARLSTAKPTEQLSYRMIVREIPVPKADARDLQLQIALAFSMPVFITPFTAKAKLDCSASRATADAIKVTCENSGSAYAHPTALQLTAVAGDKIASQETGGYLLPGIKRSFDLKKADGKIPSGKAKLVATLADGTTLTYDVAIGD